MLAKIYGLPAIESAFADVRQGSAGESPWRGQSLRTSQPKSSGGDLSGLPRGSVSAFLPQWQRPGLLVEPSRT
jgi:hypothetical protein